MTLRSPIVSVLGHVDHGKSSILDAIRESNIVAKEAGRITQAIGASIIPIEVIKKKTGALLANTKTEITIPGLLFIDTPGHAAFTSLRKRGGSLADIAIIVVDINEGFKPQTEEAIEILRACKTPFVIAANKMDLISGYRAQSEHVLKDISLQSPAWQTTFETRIYEIVGKLHERFGMQSERFDRIESFTKQIAIVPVSAVQRKGIAELLMVLSGLAQKFLEENLKLNVSGGGKGTVLEVKETTGFGTTIDVILYDGTLKKNDTIVIGGIDEPIVTKVRAILEPSPLQEMRDKKSKYTQLQSATAATGLRIAAPELEKVIAGMPLRVATDDLEAVKEELQREVEGSLIVTDKEGVIIKADTIGGLEALSVLLKEKSIPIMKASVGNISKRDIADAEANKDINPLYAVVLGFNITSEPTDSVKIITSEVIYHIIDEYAKWQQVVQQQQQAKQLETLTRPCKIEVLANCIFRQNNPCIAGVEILNGTLKVGMPLMKADGSRLTTVHSIQRQKESAQEAKFGEQVAVSLPHVTAGRQLFELDKLYSLITEDDFRELKKLTRYLDSREKDALKEIAEIMRKEKPLWGI